MTLTSDPRMENSHYNTNVFFHATSIAEHKKIIIATSVLTSCNMCRASDDEQKIRHLSRSITDTLN